MARYDKPTDYLLGETHVIRKSHAGRLRVALLYPNSYHVGMSNLAIHALYTRVNAYDYCVCERAFLPETGDTRPLRTLESGTVLSDMDVIAFSVSYEMDYPNIPRMLRLGGIEPFVLSRDGAPFVIAGGATINYNPEPLAPFLDAAFIGEAEGCIDSLLQAIHERVRSRSDKALSAHAGVYVPVHGARPTSRVAVADLNAIPIETAIYSDATEFGHMFLTEVGRGCPYGCRFCVASHLYRPARWRSFDSLWPGIEEGLKHRRKIGLIGASVTDHPAILRICDAILTNGGFPSPASMRADALSSDLLALFARGRIHSITLAPEAGRESLRRRIGKNIFDESLFAAAIRAKQAGIRQLKLYFIVGLPGEEPEDIAAIPQLVLRLAKESGLRISIGCSAFVPKPGTPFEREAMAPTRQIKQAFMYIARALQGKAEFTHESARWAYWQSVLARGGRELAPALALIASGTDTPSAWQRAFQEMNLDGDYYALRTLPSQESLPWAHIGVKNCVAIEKEKRSFPSNIS